MNQHPDFRVVLVFAGLLVSLCAGPLGCTHGNSLTPEIPEMKQGELESVVILATNDIHGSLAPQVLKTRDPSPIEYQAGGAAYLASYVKALKSEFKDHFLWLDAGDQFQGSIESNAEHGKPMVAFFNLNGLNAAAIGNHEFDYGPEPESASDLLGALKNRMGEAHYPYLAANIQRANSSELADFPNTEASHIFKAGGLKVGVIGLSTLDTPTTTRAENVKSLQFGDLKEATLREAKKLRESGVQIVVLTAHVGLFCSQGKTSAGHVFRKPYDKQGGCGDNDEMVRLLNVLPPGTVDAVVAGHSHQVIHHWVAGVPVVQGGAMGRYFNLIYLTYDWQQRKVLDERSRIEGPVPVCPLVFANQGDCNGERSAPKNGRGKLQTPSFHGVKINEDSASRDLLRPVFLKSSELKAKIVGQAARPLEHERYRESPLGNLIADALRDAAKTDFALVNPGGIRAGIESGAISYGALFKTLPFENNIAILKVTGKELKLILRLSETGEPRGFFPTSGLKIRVIDPAQDAPSDDLNHDKKIETWEINRLLEVTQIDGTPIKAEKVYTLALPDFLVTGGDHLGWIMDQIPKAKIQMEGIGLMRDAVEAYLKKSGTLNTESHPLLDAQSPRLVFVKVAKKSSGKKRRRRRARH